MQTFNQRTSNENEEDEKLLCKCADGDKSSFAQLYRRHHASMIRVAYRYLNGADYVEDVIHEAMIILWQKAGEFEGRSRVKTWMLGIVILKARELTRKHQRQISLSELGEGFDIDDLQADGLDKPEDTMGQNRDIRQVMSQLSDDHRSCIELAYFVGLTHKEISNVMQCPVNTVKTRIHFAKKYLKRNLEVSSHVDTSYVSK